ncbi:MAG: 16S rRNA (adenine(1518)-N(6)/adenine(1519)-N(6))-dimethyltransferase RsmA [Lachnospiraceae bacterium]|nr:16S rRNA (adenine(1518)-N(6)/adenine(1519)-N(6))-dimethyltransferase RsmA [Lachnospiraceae bacterium]
MNVAAKHVLDRHGFHFQKKYGQNFLFDINLLDDIAASASVGRQDFVVEIGPGMGSLTARLAQRAKKVLAIEIDGNLIPILKETLADYDNIEILHADVMKIDLAQVIREFIGQSERETIEKKARKEQIIDEITDATCDPTREALPPVKFVANLPYYITTPIIMRLLEEGGAGAFSYDSITVMVQKEVAERMVCGPGSKDYGALSLAVQYYTKPQIVREVPAESFYPPPKVDSAVVHLAHYDKPPVEAADERLLFALIRASFNQRRKTLINGLFNGSGLAFSKEEYADILQTCGFPADIRGEKLSLADFAALTNEIYRRKA